MKLVLTNFGQDISLTGEPTTVYLVMTDEETGQVYRLPTTQDTITRIALILDGSYEGEPQVPDSQPPEPPDREGLEDEPEEELEGPEEGAHIFGGDVPPAAPPVPAIPKPAPMRKKLQLHTPRTVASAPPLEDHQDEADAGVPEI